MANGTLHLSESLDELKETVKQIRFYKFQSSPRNFSVPDAFHTTKTETEALVTMRVADESNLEKLAATHRCQYEIRDLSLEDIFVEVVSEG